MTDCPGCKKLATASSSLIADLPHSQLVLGDHQAFPGYAVLWSKLHVKELHHLSTDAYAGFMQDLRRVSAAVEQATQCCKLNVVSLGNIVQHAHVHLMPRSTADPHKLEHPWVHEAAFGEPGSDTERQAWVTRIRQCLEKIT